MRIEIQGRSDDTIGAYGLPADAYANDDGGEAMDDRDTCGNNDPPSTFDIISDVTRERCRVTCIYNGCWSFAVGLVDEDDDAPLFLETARLRRREHGIDVLLDVPEGTRVVWNRRE
jgi:hypothetical protein